MGDDVNDQQYSFRFQDAGVLIVDENAGFMDLTTQILMGFGFRKFERRASLSDAEAPRTRFDPDLIIVDPFPDIEAGLRIIDELRRRQAASALPSVVIVLTGHTPRPLIDKARRAGADYIVAKPFSANVLLDRILWSASTVFSSAPSAAVVGDERTYRASIDGATAALLQ